MQVCDKGVAEAVDRRPAHALQARRCAKRQAAKVRVERQLLAADVAQRPYHAAPAQAFADIAELQIGWCTKALALRDVAALGRGETR